RFLARLPDSDSDLTEENFTDRWRRFHSVMNLYQFQPEFYFWAVSECQSGTAPDIDEFMLRDKALSEEWQEIIDLAITRLRPHLERLAFADISIPVPGVEFEHPEMRDEVAELGWKEARVVVLSGGQE